MRKVSSLYVHLPFCRRKCFYCDFPVVAGSVSPLYLSALQRDLTDTQEENKLVAPLQTLYFGGGTPTLLSEAQLAGLMQKVTSLWPLAPGAEVSIECDPGTLTASKAALLRDIGINRVSVGAQTLDDSVLSAAGRSHTVADFWQTINLLLAAGFSSEQLCVDLIIGLPHATEKIWEETLRQVLKAQPGHLSTYFLTLEEHTPFHRKYTEHCSPLPSENGLVDMYNLAHTTASSAGYSHYEISNYARAGRECRHSHMYWSGNADFLAVGLGAASYLSGVRFIRPRQLSSYYRWVETKPRVAGFPDTQMDSVKNRLMYQMRRAVGINLEEYRRDFGAAVSTAIRETLSPLIDSELIVNEGAQWRLSVPKGFLVSSSVLSELFLVIEDALQASLDTCEKQEAIS